MTTRARKQPKADDRQPPRDVDAEKAVLGSLLLDSRTHAASVVEMITPSDFYDDADACIFRHMLAILSTGALIDMALLVRRLRDAGEYDKIGGAVYLSEVTRAVPTASNAMHYASIVKQLSNKRRAIEIGHSLIEGGYNG